MKGILYSSHFYFNHPYGQHSISIDFNIDAITIEFFIIMLSFWFTCKCISCLHVGLVKGFLLAALR